MAEIKRRQTLLFNAFSYQGVLGGRYLGPTMDGEKLTGEIFVKKYHGHRVLADSFLEFFGASLVEQVSLNNKIGWPQDQPYYVTCLLMYLTMFRGVRASEVLSVNGYPLQAYVLQRSLKDQALVLCAATSGLSTFEKLFGWEGLPATEWPEEQEKLIVRNRQSVEREIRDLIIGKKSDLSEQSQKQLETWDRMFNVEAHRGLYTLFRESHEVLVDKRLNISLAPQPDDLRDPMFINRSTEMNWMMLRLLPFMRRRDTPHSDTWNQNWSLLDNHFRWMVEGLGGIGKQIAFAVIEMIDHRFRFDPFSTYFTDDAVAARKADENKYRPFRSP